MPFCYEERMRRFFGILSILVVSLVALGLLCLALAPKQIEKTLSAKLQVPVKVGQIGLGIQSLTVRLLDIGNPPKSILPFALQTHEITVTTPWKSYLDKDIVIEEITVEGIHLGLEFDSPTSAKGNWTQIMGNLKQNTPSSQTAASNRSLLIRKLVLTDVHVDLVYRAGNRKVQRLKPIPRLEFTNISSANGLPMDQLLNSVLGQMLQSVFIKENLKNMLEEALENIPERFEPFVEPFKFLLPS